MYPLFMSQLSNMNHKHKKYVNKKIIRICVHPNFTRGKNNYCQIISIYCMSKLIKNKTITIRV